MSINHAKCNQTRLCMYQCKLCKGLSGNVFIFWRVVIILYILHVLLLLHIYCLKSYLIMFYYFYSFLSFLDMFYHFYSFLSFLDIFKHLKHFKSQTYNMETLPIQTLTDPWYGIVLMRIWRTHKSVLEKIVWRRRCCLIR